MSKKTKDLVGEVLLGYELLELLETGGSSEIYRAKPKGLENKEVVIKIAKRAHPKYNKDLEQLAKTLDEIRHPNIIGVLNFGNYEGRNFLVLEKMQSDLRDGANDLYLDRLSDRLAKIAVQALKGLENAHDNGVIHQDLTPGNILLDEEGNVKLTDFFDPDVYAEEIEEEVDDLSSIKSVREGQKNGDDVIDARRKYLAPEQKGLIDSEIDERTDIYALGMILYEVLMGSIPAGNYEKISEKRPSCPKWFEQAIDKALAGNPGRRFRNAREMRQHLEKGLEGKLGKQAVSRPKRLSGLVDAIKWPFRKISDLKYHARYNPEDIVVGALIIGIIGLVSTVAYFGFRSDIRSKKVGEQLKCAKGMIAYVEDNKVGLLTPKDASAKIGDISPAEYETPATDLVGVQWRNDGKKLLLIDEPLKRGFNNDVEDTALYVFDMNTKSAKKILDIEKLKYNAIKEAYWSKSNPDLVYVNLDHMWYTIDISSSNYTLTLAKDGDKADMDSTQQTHSPSGRFCIKLGKDKDIDFIWTTKDWEKGTGIDAEDAAWYHDGLKPKAKEKK